MPRETLPADHDFLRELGRWCARHPLRERHQILGARRRHQGALTPLGPRCASAAG
jgi:hypothetical protein